MITRHCDMCGKDLTAETNGLGIEPMYRIKYCGFVETTVFRFDACDNCFIKIRDFITKTPHEMEENEDESERND